MSDSTRENHTEQIADWLKILVEPDSTFEMRVLCPNGRSIVRHYAATDLTTIACDAIRFGQNAKGVYWLMNSLPIDWNGSPAKDADIVRRRWLMVDCDPKRKGSVSSTGAEKDAARAKAVEVDAFLNELGWPAPIIGDSGNGWHLLYRVDLPEEDGGLLHRVLQTLARLFDNESVTIDTKVGNASRICKLYGTLAAKGEPTTERPHRLSKIVQIPERLLVVSVDMLQKLTDEGDAAQEANGKPVSPPDDATQSCPTTVERARKYLAMMDASIEGSNGSNRLIKAASVLVNDFNITDTAAFELLKSEFNPRCEPPWSDAEIRHKIKDAKKSPPYRPAKGLQTRNTTTEAIVVRLSEVLEQPVEWLWANRIPLGKLTLLAGDPGVGKSFLTVDMAARVSTGRGWPDCCELSQPVGSVVMFNCEDDIADTVKPRLQRAGGDPTKVIALRGIAITDAESGQRRERGFSLNGDLPKLIEVLEKNPDVRLVVIDPVSAYCGATDSHKNADIRAMLAPLAEMASKYRVAVVMVTHFPKGSGGKSVHRAMGSLAFTAAARAVWHVVKDLDDDQLRLVLLAKMNVAVEANGLAFRLNDGEVCWESNCVVLSADEHLEKEAQLQRKPLGNGDRAEAVKQAVEWLNEKLAHCSIRATAVKEMADDDDISESTLKRAKKLAKVDSHRVGFGDKSAVWWTLPLERFKSSDFDAAHSVRLEIQI